MHSRDADYKLSAPLRAITGQLLREGVGQGPNFPTV